MKKVYIHAYMAGNLGDDLMVKLLCKRYPKVKFFVFADESYQHRYQDITNLSVIAPPNKTVTFRDGIFKKTWNRDDIVRGSDAVVHIGGSVFVQHFDDWSNFYQADSRLVRDSKKMFVIGANFGPYENPEYYQQYEQLFRQYTGICFRDQYSKNLFPNHNNITWAPDVVFNYQPKYRPPTKKQVLISAIDLKDRGGKYSICQYQKDYETFLQNLAICYLKKGYLVQFISFCKMQGDETAIQRMIGKIPSEYQENLSTYFYDTNLEECCSLFYESEIIVGTRFHSIILGWLAGKKVLPIIYDFKTRNTLADVPSQFVLELQDLKTIDPQQMADQLEQMPPFQPDELIQQAPRQFEALDQIL